jgi:hypothetical protein
MLAASSLVIFLVPMLYVVFQTLRERVKSRFGMAPQRADSQPAAGVESQAAE